MCIHKNRNTSFNNQSLTADRSGSKGKNMVA